MYLYELSQAKSALSVILTKCIFVYFLNVHYFKINVWNFEWNSRENKLSMGSFTDCILVCSSVIGMKCHVVIFTQRHANCFYCYLFMNILHMNIICAAQ